MSDQTHRNMVVRLTVLGLFYEVDKVFPLVISLVKSLVAGGVLWDLYQLTRILFKPHSVSKHDKNYIISRNCK